MTAEFGGLSADADVVLDRDRILAADVIAVMERAQLAWLKRQFGPDVRGKRVVCLDVPDRFACMDPERVALLTRQFARLD